MEMNGFLDTAKMLENYIIKKLIYNHNGQIEKWKSCLKSMTKEERKVAEELIAKGKGNVSQHHENNKIKNFLSHYRDEQL